MITRSTAVRFETVTTVEARMKNQRAAAPEEAEFEYWCAQQGAKAGSLGNRGQRPRAPSILFLDFDAEFSRSTCGAYRQMAMFVLYRNSQAGGVVASANFGPKENGGRPGMTV